MSTVFYWYETTTENLWIALALLKNMFDAKCASWGPNSLSYYRPIWYTVYKPNADSNKLFIMITWFNGRWGTLWDIPQSHTQYVWDVSYDNRSDNENANVSEDDLDNINTNNILLYWSFQKISSWFDAEFLKSGMDDFSIPMYVDDGTAYYWLLWKQITVTFKPKFRKETKKDKKIKGKDWAVFHVSLYDIKERNKRLSILKDWVKNPDKESRVFKDYSYMPSDYVKTYLKKIKMESSWIDRLSVWSTDSQEHIDKVMEIVKKLVQNEIKTIVKNKEYYIDFDQYSKLKLETITCETVADMWWFFWSGEKDWIVIKDWWTKKTNKIFKNFFFKKLLSNLK